MQVFGGCFEGIQKLPPPLQPWPPLCQLLEHLRVPPASRSGPGEEGKSPLIEGDHLVPRSVSLLLENLLLSVKFVRMLLLV